MVMYVGAMHAVRERATKFPDNISFNFIFAWP